MQNMRILNRERGLGGRAFLLALTVSAVTFLPFVIIDGGYFIYYGDFNVQQIPFYKLAHEAVRSGDVFWSWYTDLGANFIGSYSFYLLFSPFFWLTLPFPTSALPFLMAPLLVLKTACASFTAYLYLERFVRDNRYAVLGALFYAFSGWMDFNIFFNHFHEAAVFFPLLLLGAEKLVTEDKKCLFALAVAVNALVNYWFFVGEAVFVLIYVLIRMSDKNWGMSVRKFARMAFEAILGTGLAAVALVPSVMALMGNPRTGADELVIGWNAWLFWHEQRYPAILQSLIFPPELPARPNFFPDHGAKWASLSAWLPMISLTGVLAYFFARKNDWIKKILGLSLLFALVPGLNSLFILLNNSYYARWFYMPVLLMSLASVRAVEDSAVTTAHFVRAIKWVGALTFVISLMCGVTPRMDDDVLKFGLAKDLPLMWTYTGIAFAGLCATAVVILHLRYHKRFIRILTISVAVFSAGFTIFYIAAGKSYFERSHFIINTAIGGREQIDLPTDTFARSDTFDEVDSKDNLLMFWHLPNIQAFHSIVPVSIMEFYPEVGVKRDVGSRPEKEFVALRPLLSVRWLFIDSDSKEQSPMPGYKKYGEQAGFNIYENENFIPMGFCYDSFIYENEFDVIDKNLRSNMMLKAVVLDEGAVARNSDILWHMEVTGDEDLSFEELEADAEERRRFTADTFQHDTRGFTATTSFESPQLVFFSVPRENGWSAKINGEPVQIECANIGFMAVRVPAGRCEIRFDYFTPGLVYGALISLGALAVFMICALAAFIRYKRQPELDVQTALFNGITVEMSIDEYLARYGDKAARSVKLQRMLNEAAAKHIPEKLSDDEKTFRFSIDGDTDGKSGQ